MTNFQRQFSTALSRGFSRGCVNVISYDRLRKPRVNNVSNDSIRYQGDNREIGEISGALEAHAGVTIMSFYG